MSSVRIDRSAITIGGRKTILLCASLFYFRIPREDWQKRMTELRSCGYNCIDVYFPWNFHELHPDDWCFEGVHDCAAFLDLAAENQLYVIARPGPYICSEWDGGALPAWLNDVCPDIRQNEDAYLQYLSRWLNRILPVIAAHEAGKGGSVVALQLENELDFFACRDPEGYMLQLEKIAAANGITVPLTACAGECDIQGAGGEAGQVHPTFNAYCPEDFAFLECQLAHMRTLAAGRNTPLLITETNREHGLLKRELLCGARLISPYNQVGGTDIDMTNGISNWASDLQRPLALMATDYDFHSMITVDGRKRPEAISGRLMGRLIASLGEVLAGAEPAASPLRIDCAFPHAKYWQADGKEVPFFPAAKAECGLLYGVSNLGSEAGHFTAEGEGASLHSSVPAGETRIYPWNFSLLPWGHTEVIRWAEAELVAIEARNEQLTVTFAGSPEEKVCILRENREHILTGCGTVGGVRIRILSAEEAAREACEALPDLEGSVPSAIQTTETQQVTRHECRIEEQSVPVGDLLQPMEDYGVYRGDIFYQVQLEKESTLIMTGAADLVWMRHPERCLAFYGDGATREVTGWPTGKTVIRAQSWGHVNFDDVRQPSLKMGSKKGLGGLYTVQRRQELTDLWLIYPEAKYAVQRRQELQHTDRIMATSLNSWSYPASPMKAKFTHPVWLDEDCDSFFLYIEHLNAEISVSVSGNAPRAFRASDHFVQLNVPEGFRGSAELQLTISRHFSHDSLGSVILYQCRSLQSTAVSAFPVENWQALRTCGEGKRVALPVSLGPDEECLLTGIGGTAGKACTLVIDGTGMEATLCGHGHVIGRVQLKTPGYPEVRGGSSRRIYVPAGWNDDSLLLHLAALGQGGQLTGLHQESVIL